jgi:LysR family transcriptional regulator, transcriptional activator of the cysJI operon
VASLENFRLVVFRAVAAELSFRKAAEDLYLTQPAVSLQIKALEEDLGVQLFDRTGKAIALTAAGRILLGYAEQAGELLLQAEQEIASLDGAHAGNLALGASTTIAQYVLPRLLSDFCREHPRVRPTLISGNTEKIVEAIEKQKIALGFIEGPAQNRNVKTEPFLRDELVPIASAAHPWATRDSVPCAELCAAPLLMRERGSGSRRVAEMAIERHGVKRSALRIAMELDSTEAIKSAVEAGLGIGFVSLSAIATDLRLNRSIKVIHVQGLKIPRDFLVAYPAGPKPGGAAQEFRKFLFTKSRDQGTKSRDQGNEGTRDQEDGLVTVRS